MADHLRLEIDNSPTARPEYDKQGAGEPPGGDDMQARVRRLEDAFLRFDGKLDGLSNSLSEVKVSQARIQERMERIMDRSRDMPTEASVSKLLNAKLTVLGVVVAAVVGFASLFIAG